MFHGIEKNVDIVHTLMLMEIYFVKINVLIQEHITFCKMLDFNVVQIEIIILPHLIW